MQAFVHYLLTTRTASSWWRRRSPRLPSTYHRPKLLLRFPFLFTANLVVLRSVRFVLCLPLLLWDEDSSAACVYAAYASPAAAFAFAACGFAAFARLLDVWRLPVLRHTVVGLRVYTLPFFAYPSLLFVCRS